VRLGLAARVDVLPNLLGVEEMSRESALEAQLNMALTVNKRAMETIRELDQKCDRLVRLNNQMFGQMERAKRLIMQGRSENDHKGYLDGSFQAAYEALLVEPLPAKK
jgi:hypothetical protein